MIYYATDRAGNSSTGVILTINVVDTTPPTITLDRGDITLDVGSAFVDPGYTVTDNFPTINTILDKPTYSIALPYEVDTSKVGTYKVYYLARDGQNNIMYDWTTRTVTVKQKISRRIV